MILFLTILFLILATGFCRVAGQDFVLPRHVVYVWNGDGTFTKTGIADDVLKKIEEGQ